MRKVERKQTRMLREALKEERCVGGYAMFPAVELAIVRLVKLKKWVGASSGSYLCLLSMCMWWLPMFRSKRAQWSLEPCNTFYR